MADEKKDQAEFTGKGEATVENTETGEKSKVEFSGKATVTSLSEKKAEKEGEAACLECGDDLTRIGNQWVCVNPNCSRAQAQASRGGSRSTAKAVAAAPPRAFSRSGRVD